VDFKHILLIFQNLKGFANITYI